LSAASGPVLELYHAPVSMSSQKVCLALAEKRLPWVDCFVDLARGEHLDEWYLRINPNGLVPTLVHDGRAIIDSAVINEYLDEVFPDPPLRPADPVARARMRAWRQFANEVALPAIRYPSFNAFVLARLAHQSDTEFAAQIERRPLRRRFYERLRNRKGFDAETIEEALEDLRLTIARMEEALAAGPWLAGNAYTLADIALAPVLVRMNDIGLASLWAECPRVAEWYARIEARPAFAEAYLPPARDLQRPAPQVGQSGSRGTLMR
jgi:glutathione S-transferase